MGRENVASFLHANVANKLLWVRAHNCMADDSVPSHV